MRRSCIRAIIFVFSLCVLGGVARLPDGQAFAFADLSDVGMGARPLSLGRAYTALSSDGSGIFTNPAGLSDFPKWKIISMTGRLIEDINYFSFGISNSNELGALGLGYISAGTSGIPLTTLTSTLTGDVISNPYAFTDYTSSIYYLSFSKKLYPGLSFGTNVKYFAQNFSYTTGAMDGGAGTGAEADLGMKWHPKNWLSFGGVLRNLLPESMGGKFTWKKNNREEGIPVSLNLGTHIKLFGLGGLKQFRDQNVAVLIDAQTLPKLSRPTLFKTGVEWWVTRGFALRGGVDQDYRATPSGGTDIENNLTLGAGLKVGGFNFDYAYHQYGEIKGNISHFFSLGYIGFDETGEQTLHLAGPKTNGLVPRLKAKPGLKSFTDVDDYFWAKDSIEYISALGIMEGFPDNTFRPNDPLTRAQMSVLLVKAKGFEVASGEASLFYDLPAGHWSAPYVNMAVRRKYVAGYPAGDFQPGRALSRAEGVAILGRFGGLTPPQKLEQHPYADVDKSRWYARMIDAAKKAGLLEYISEAEFKPDQILTRAEAAEIISKTKFGRERIYELLKK